MKTKIKMFALFFASGLLLGLLLSAFFLHRSKTSLPAAVAVAKTATDAKEDVAVAEYNFRRSTDSLKQQSTRLVRELRQTKTALDASKQNVHNLQVQVFDLLDRRFERQQSDTSERECDSLSHLVPSLITASIERDSLADKALINLTSQLAVKDSVVQLKDSAYNSLKRSFESTLAGQQLLEQQNASLGKQVKRQRTKSKIVSTALFILSGAFAKAVLSR